MNDYFDMQETEKMLDLIISNDLSQMCNSVVANRFVAEKANFIANLLPQMKRFDFKINKEILEVATRKYSFLFFPELTHLNHVEYERQFKLLYSTVLSLVLRPQKISILDLGCGICDLAGFLSSQHVFDSYHAVDKNQFVVNVNQSYYKGQGIIHECSDITNYQILQQFDYVFLFNVVKHLKKEEVKQLIERVFSMSPNATILIQDVQEIVDTIVDEYIKEQYGCKYEGSFLCLSKSE